MLGTVISERYKLIRFLGGGGMSHVYLADDIILNRKVAVKIITIPPVDVDRAGQRFEREVQNTTSLSHQNIVKVLDVDEDEHHYYLIMEYIEGPTLHEYIREKGKLEVEEAVLFTKQLIRGIEHAHQHRIIHRDIKPQNILMTNDKELKITDFGIARALSETAMTQTNHIMGSVHYLSPEQAKGKPTDEASDIYSIGIVLFEMLAGHPPFEAETAVGVAIKHIQDPLPSVRDENAFVPQSLENVIIKATMKEKYKRYRTTNEMYDDINTCLDQDRIDESKIIHEEDKTRVIPVIQDDTIPVAPIQEKHLENKYQKIENETPKEEEEAKENKKSKKRFFLMLTSLLLLIACLAGFIYWLTFAPKYSHIPKIEGVTVSEAVSLLEQENLRKGKVTYQYSEKVDSGIIIKASPSMGTKVKEMTPVDLLVSKGVKLFKVRNYVGKDLDKVKPVLEKIGFENVKVKEEYSFEKKGTIIKQSIKEGQEVNPKDTAITLTVSKGVEEIYVPDYTGQSFSKAKSELEALGFVVNVVSEQYDDHVKKGHVIAQNIRNIKFAYGSTINFDISKGKENKDTKKEEEKVKADKKYAQTVTIPYRKEKPDSSESPSDPTEKPSQLVEIYIKDKTNDIGTIYESFETTETVKKNIILTIESGKTGAYIIKIDGKIYEQEQVDYDEIK